MAEWPSHVTVFEVGPRDGLQNEPGEVGLEVKLGLIERLADAGLTAIEAGAFVSPKWVPQMADSGALYQRLVRRPGVRYPALVPNEIGLARAIEAGVTEVAVFASASETFSRKNINCSIEESFARFAPVCATARAHGLDIRGYVSCALGCPYQGAVAPGAVAAVAARLVALGCTEVSLGDTIGVGTPRQALAMADAVLEQVPAERLALHFHNTYGQALANIYACLSRGIAVVDSAVGGLGGCPYASGASGNVATEDVLYMLDGLGIVTGVDLDRVVAAAVFVSEALGRPPGSRVARVRGPRSPTPPDQGVPPGPD